MTPLNTIVSVFVFYLVIILFMIYTTGGLLLGAGSGIVVSYLLWDNYGRGMVRGFLIDKS
jgi:hypothetical protein